MRIDPKNTIVPTVTPKAHREQPAAPATRRDRDAAVVSLSDAGAAAMAGDVNETVSPRVEQLRALVDAGAYQPDLEQLASRIVDDEVVRSRGSS